MSVFSASDRSVSLVFFPFKRRTIRIRTLLPEMRWRASVRFGRRRPAPSAACRSSRTPFYMAAVMVRVDTTIFGNTWFPFSMRHTSGSVGAWRVFAVPIQHYSMSEVAK